MSRKNLLTNHNKARKSINLSLKEGPGLMMINAVISGLLYPGEGLMDASGNGVRPTFMDTSNTRFSLEPKSIFFRKDAKNMDWVIDINGIIDNQIGPQNLIGKAVEVKGFSPKRQKATSITVQL